jgi:hypothetical protein
VENVAHRAQPDDEYACLIFLFRQTLIFA